MQVNNLETSLFFSTILAVFLLLGCGAEKRNASLETDAGSDTDTDTDTDADSDTDTDTDSYGSLIHDSDLGVSSEADLANITHVTGSVVIDQTSI